MEKQTHREPTLYIVGNKEREEEIKHIIEDEWGGKNEDIYYGESNQAYFIGVFGFVCCSHLDNIYFKEAVEDGLMSEYKLPKMPHLKPKFEPFDKVVARPKNGKSLWTATLLQPQ